MPGPKGIRSGNEKKSALKVQKKGRISGKAIFKQRTNVLFLNQRHKRLFRGQMAKSDKKLKEIENGIPKKFRSGNGATGKNLRDSEEWTAFKQTKEGQRYTDRLEKWKKNRYHKKYRVKVKGKGVQRHLRKPLQVRKKNTRKRNKIRKGRQNRIRHQFCTGQKGKQSRLIHSVHW